MSAKSCKLCYNPLTLGFAGNANTWIQSIICGVFIVIDFVVSFFTYLAWSVCK